VYGAHKFQYILKKAEGAHGLIFYSNVQAIYSKLKKNGNIMLSIKSYHFINLIYNKKVKLPEKQFAH
jgi:hypothetical protein